MCNKAIKRCLQHRRNSIALLVKEIGMLEAQRDINSHVLLVLFRCSCQTRAQVNVGSLLLSVDYKAKRAEPDRIDEKTKRFESDTQLQKSGLES